jgi:DNA-binding NtrC family response regulator
VLVAKDPYEALEICENQSDRVDLLLTDMVMPGMNGRVLAERITAMHPAIKVVWMSGYTDNEIISPEELSGMIFLQKPFNKDELLRKIRMALDSNPQPDGNEKKMVPSRK